MSFWGVDPSVVHPTRTPWVRDRTFLDNRLPAVDEFFDRVQLQLGAYYGAALGRSWSRQTEDFEDTGHRTGYVGKFLIIDNVDGAAAPGAVVPAVVAPLIPGEHGVWSLTSPILIPWRFAMRTGRCNLGTGDWLISAKVKIIARERLSTATEGGLHLGLGAPTTKLPGFAAGSDAETWRIYSRVKETGFPPPPGRYFDTGIACTNGRWYELQICRLRGGVRWFINGALCRFTLDGEQQEGLYLPGEMAPASSYLGIRRWSNGPADDGGYIDYFHSLRERRA